MESDSSNSDHLINLGSIAAIMVIILSGMAILSMLRNPKGANPLDSPTINDESESLFEEAVEEDEIDD